MATDLILAGYTVREALAVSEVLFLCEHHNVDVVVIGPDVEDADVVEVQMRRISLRLKPEGDGEGLDVGTGAAFSIRFAAECSVAPFGNAAWVQDGSDLDESYYQREINVVDRQMALAGLRLVRRLNETIGKITPRDFR